MFVLVWRILPYNGQPPEYRAFQILVESGVWLFNVMVFISGLTRLDLSQIGLFFLLKCNLVFKTLAFWANAFYKSKCPSVCLSARLSVCSLLRYGLNVFFSPLPKVGCPIILEIRNPWGKVKFLFGNSLKSPNKKSFISFR